MRLRFHMVLDQMWVSSPVPETRVGDRIDVGGPGMGERVWVYGVNDERTRFVVLREGWERTWSLSGN